MTGLIFIGVIALVVVLAVALILALLYRRVVRTNEVHIVQTSHDTKSFGKDTNNGNVYYAFPSWIPKLGVSTIVLPMSVFDVRINDYEAYDLERLPFKVDLTAFFRISESNLAAQRVSNFEDLQEQLEAIIQGSVRSILSSKNLNDILQMRSELGQDFTDAVREQLRNWGVEPVKSIELMDIRDSGDSKVIHNIMAIKQSDIERESRTEVARNQKEAELAEIEAKKEADIKRQEAEQAVGMKTVENHREVALTEQRAQQQIETERKNTAEQEMAVQRVNSTRQAEIAKDVAIVNAEKDQREREIKAQADRNVAVVSAEAEKSKQILIAEGQKEQAYLAAAANLETKDKEAQGIAKIGSAEAEARKLLEISLVSGQIQLAQEIGENDGYQRYLIEIRKVEADEKIGIEQAKALSAADLKLIVNDGGSVAGGMDKLSKLLSSQGGANVGAMLESLGQFENGKKLIERFMDKPNKED